MCVQIYLPVIFFVRQGPDNHSYLFSLFNGRPTKCIRSLRAKKLLSSSNVFNVIRKWLLKPSIARNREFEVVRNFR